MTTTIAGPALHARVDALDWPALRGQLDANGFAITAPLLTGAETRVRPNRGRNGHHRVGMRHGVSTVTAGQRTALGIIFHDAR
jgi:hypothetical protein